MVWAVLAAWWPARSEAQPGTIEINEVLADPSLEGGDSNGDGTISSTGAVHVTTTQLLTPEEIDQACSKKTSYKAPGA